MQKPKDGLIFLPVPAIKDGMLPGRCPKEEDLSEFALGGLEPSRHAEVEAHLVDCAECSIVAAALIEDEPGPAGDPPEKAGNGELEASAPIRYQLLGLLGEGGMGQVHEAIEVHSGRRVALKLVRDEGSPDRAKVVRRFFREARVAALLEHPNIVPVFDLAQFPDGTPYYTQRLVKGRSLAGAIAEAKGLRGRLALLNNFRDLCSAIAYAHTHGIIHRDIKSANVLIGSLGETWVIDWGLALFTKGDRAAQDVLTFGETEVAGPVSDPKITAGGAILGTPAYMSPEQARGNQVDERSDVWSLGVVLLEILTGRPPFEGLAAPDILRTLREGGSPFSSADLRRLPAELVAIAKQAVAPDPSQRYPSAGEMVVDFNNWVLGTKVHAHRYSPAQRLRFFVRRNRVLSAVMAVALIGGAAWIGYLRVANLHLLSQRAGSLVRLAESDAHTLLLDRAAVIFAQALDLEDRHDARLGLAISGESGPRPLWKQEVPDGPARFTAFAEEGTLVTGGAGGLVAFDVESGAEVARAKLPAPSAALAGCSAGSIAVATGSSVQIWRPREGTLGALIAQPHPVLGVSLDGDCDLLATTSVDGVRVYRMPRGELVARFGEDEEAVGVGWLGGRRLVWATSHELHEVSDALSGDAHLLPATRGGEIHGLSSAGGRLLVLRESGYLEFLDASGPGAKPLSRGKQPVPVSRAVLFPNGLSAVVFDLLSSTWFIDVDTGIPYFRLARLERPPLSSAVSPGTRWLATSGEDGLLRVYDLADSRSYAGIRPDQGARPTDLSWSPQGALLASSEEDGTIRLWDVATGRPRAPLGRHEGKAWAVRFSSDGRALASVGPDGLRLWDPQAIDQPGKRMGPSARALAWMADGRVAVAGEDGQLRLYGLDGGEQLVPREHPSAVLALAGSPDGRRLATGDTEGTIAVHDLRRGSVAWGTANSGPIRALAWSPDGRVIVSGGADSTLRSWDADSLVTSGHLDSYAGEGVTSLDFAPGETGARRELIAGYGNGMVVIWDPSVEDATLTMGIQTFPSIPTAAARFSPDGHHLAVLSGAGRMRIVSLQPGGARGRLERLLHLYKFKPAGQDVMRDERALVPPALRAGH